LFGNSVKVKQKEKNGIRDSHFNRLLFNFLYAKLKYSFGEAIDFVIYSSFSFEFMFFQINHNVLK